MAFIINRRNRTNPTATITGAIPPGVLQAQDLWPNASQRNQIYDPVANGPQYCNAPERVIPQDLFPYGARTLHRTITASGGAGLVNWLLMNVGRGAAQNDNLTLAEAAACANAIVAIAEAGTALTGGAGGTVSLACAAAVTLLDADATAAGTRLLGAGVPVDYLRILAGYDWSLQQGIAFSVPASATITVDTTTLGGGETVTITVPSAAGAQVFTVGGGAPPQFAGVGLANAVCAANLAAAINAQPALSSATLVDGVRASNIPGSNIVTLTATLGGNTPNTTALATTRCQQLLFLEKIPLRPLSP